MNAQQTAIAHACMAGAYSGEQSFPKILGALGAAGIEGYIVDYRRSLATYYAPDGDSCEVPCEPTAAKVADRFDAAEIAANIRAAQAGGPDYSYRGFCERVKAAGCAGYQVSLLGRRAVYFGRSGETHVELFPQPAE